jgi:hypothetical protein
MAIGNVLARSAIAERLGAHLSICTMRAKHIKMT